MTRPQIKLVFLDHAYHFKTRSGDFLRDIFKSKFLIKNFWVDKNLEFDEKFYSHENYFFFQILPPLKVLKRLKGKNLMWAPMYDSHHHPIGLSPLLWKIINFYKIKVLSFSKKLSNLMNESNVNFINLKYYKKSIVKKVKKKKKVNIFFLFRADLQIKNWINLFDPSTVNEIYLFCHKDQKKPIIPDNVKNNFKINYIIKNFTKNNHFLKILNKSDIFIAPRRKEGIGMALIEALARGKYVVGNNESTMNEYIKNKKIGLLTPTNKKFQISFLNKYSNYRFKINDTFYQKWNNEQHKILIFFNSINPIEEKHKINLINIYIIYYLKLIIRKFIL